MDNDKGKTLFERLSAQEENKRRTPANAIVPQKKVEKWDTQIDGIVIDQDIMYTELVAQKHRLKSMVTWNFIRDMIVILLLLMCTGLVLWRGLLVEHRLDQCAQLDGVTIMDKSL